MILNDILNVGKKLKWLSNLGCPLKRNLFEAFNDQFVSLKYSCTNISSAHAWWSQICMGYGTFENILA